MSKHELDIQSVNNYYDSIIDNDIHHYSPTKYPIIYGYNEIFSGRSGGKTTNILLWCMCAYQISHTSTMYVKTIRQETTRKYINTLFNTINTYICNDGRNYVQRITNDTYDTVLYVYSKKHFVLHNSETGSKPIDSDPIFMDVCSIDQAYEMRSSHNDIFQNIVFYDECINDNVTNETLLKLMHIIKTCFTTRDKSVVWITGNLGTGSMALLHSQGIYEKIMAEQREYTVYDINGTKIACEIYSPDVVKTNEYSIINERFFNFNVDGAEIVRGQALNTMCFRSLPDLINDKWTITPTKLYIHSLGYYLQILYCVCETWQAMYLVRECIEPVHDGSNIMLTDDKSIAYTTPYTYYNVGKQFEIARDFAVKYIRNDVCCSDNMVHIAVDAFYNNHLK